MDEILLQELKEQLMEQGLDEDSAEILAHEYAEETGVLDLGDM